MTTSNRSARRILSVKVYKLHDSDPDLSYLDTDTDDGAERFDAYDRGVWCMVGVRAVAEVVIGGLSQTLSSGGIWGVESDSGKDYFEQLRADELGQLAEVLRDTGCSRRQVKAALAGAEWTGD